MITRCLLLVAPSAPWLLTNPPAAAYTASRHRSVVACDEPFSRIDRTIGEILDEERSDELPALLGRRLDVLTDPSFLARIEERRASAPPGRREELERVGEVVVTFLEALTSQVGALQPELEEEERAAQEMTTRAAEAAAKAARDAQLPPPPAFSGRDGLPSLRWLSGFCARWGLERVPRAPVKLVAPTRSAVNAWFVVWEDVCRRFGITADRAWNMDEVPPPPPHTGHCARGHPRPHTPHPLATTTAYIDV
jgi:hypothetical protein